MIKPTKIVVEFFDWFECKDYINEKYNIDINDYGKRFTKDGKNSNPYLDFWHYICNSREVANGSTITFENDELSYPKEQWQKEILELILSEFGEGEYRECVFRTAW